MCLSSSCRYIRSERSVILINFCLSIISSNALILIGQTQTRNKVRWVWLSNIFVVMPFAWVCVNQLMLSVLVCCLLMFQILCTLIAAFLHFFFLSSFCWVLTEAWQSYMAVTGRLRNRIIRKRFLCLGWGGLSLYCVSVLFNSYQFYFLSYFPFQDASSPYLLPIFWAHILVFPISYSFLFQYIFLSTFTA